ncbi:MAG TPA: ATP-binding cassette domain-containing protein [Gammaproteobacteria bacterium]|nr:ATP-binding cassette domain-containing protein [Gammaproteobacteria bacterium]
MSVVVETESLTRRFDAHVAVDSLDLTIQGGEIFAVLGPNGAGKTTVIKMLTTLLPPSSGRARVAGFDIVRQAGAVRRAIGYVPQLISADGMLTGYENLLIFAKLYDVPRRERQARIGDALEFMELGEAAGRLVSQYSGGMIRRLEIAQSMLHMPRVLFLDEPTSGLDPIARNAVWDHLVRLRDRFGTTIVFTTHLMEEADAFCSRLAILHGGKLVAENTPAALKAGIGRPDATLDDVFVHFAGGGVEDGGGFRETARVRHAAHRLG